MTDRVNKVLFTLPDLNQILNSLPAYREIERNCMFKTLVVSPRLSLPPSVEYKERNSAVWTTNEV